MYYYVYHVYHVFFTLYLFHCNFPSLAARPRTQYSDNTIANHPRSQLEVCSAYSSLPVTTPLFCIRSHCTQSSCKTCFSFSHISAPDLFENILVSLLLQCKHEISPIYARLRHAKKISEYHVKVMRQTSIAACSITNKQNIYLAKFFVLP
jgi:hypothetical protein